MVEVTLAQYNEDTAKPKQACWYPFQKQRENRISEGWEDDGSKHAKLNGLRLCSSSSAKNIERKEREKRKNAKKKSGSVSTATETDNSFLSQETPVTAKTGNSSQSTYRVNHNKDLNDDQNSLAGYSYQTNSIAASPNRASHESPSPYNQSPLRFNRRIRPNQSPGDLEFQEAEKLAEVETNCMSKDFWAEEAYACTEGRNKKKRDLERQQQKDVNNSLSSPRGVDGYALSQKTEPTNQTSLHSLGGLVRFVSQDPEDANDGAPLRRILCTSAPMMCRSRIAAPPQQKGNDTDIFKVLHKHSANAKNMPQLEFEEEEEPNFYVEVEAVDDQLNQVKDLDDFSKTDSRETVGNSTVQQAPIARNRDFVDAAIDARARAHRQREQEKQRRENTYVPPNEPSRPTPMRPQGPRKEKEFRDRLREKIGRQNQLLSEVVSDRVLSMKGGNDIGLNPMGSRDELEERQSTMKTSNRGYKSVGFVHHNRHVNKKHSPPRRSYQPNNISGLTETSQDQYASEYPSIKPMHTWDNEECYGEWGESEIGYYRKPSSPSQPNANWAPSPQRNLGADEAKFDDNFWKEDVSDINSAMFEKFGSEVDSVFGDLKSQSSVPEFDPRSSKAQFLPSEDSFQHSFGSTPSSGQNRLGKPIQRYTMQAEVARPKGKRTTYLQ